MAIRIGAITAEIHFGASGYAEYVVSVLVPMAVRANVRLPKPVQAVIADAEPLVAFLHTDRWLVQCPDCGTDFQYVFRARSERLYMCANCWNVETGGRYRPVTFPDGAEAVEQAMGRVGYPEGRCWLPAEYHGRLLGSLKDEGPPQTVAEIMAEIGE